MRGGHCLKHWSVTQKCVTLSSGEAELAGVVKAAGEALGLQSLAKDFGQTAAAQVHADSSAAIGICSRSGIGKVRHLAVGQLWVQERIRSKAFTLHKVLGEDNPADLLTKHLGQQPMHHHMAAIGGVYEGGRAVAAPALTAQVRSFLEEKAERKRD